MNSGIYMIKNIINNKIYIGQTINVNARLKSHRNKLKNNNHENQHLQNSWNKYRENNFKFEIIKMYNEDELNDREVYWINYYKSYDFKFGYNKTFGGNSERPTEETKNKMSIAAKGRKLSIEIKRKLSQSLKGKNKGNFLSEETKKKLSQSLKGKNAGEKNYMYGKKGKLSPNYGIKRSQDWINNLSKKLKGKSRSAETKEKISKTRKEKYPNKEDQFWFGKKHSEESKMKISKTKKAKNIKLSNEHKSKLLEINTGRIHSKESREKMKKAKYKLTDDQVIEILKKLNNGELPKNICKNYNVSDKTIIRIGLNQTYTHINRNILEENKL